MQAIPKQLKRNLTKADFTVPSAPKAIKINVICIDMKKKNVQAANQDFVVGSVLTGFVESTIWYDTW